MPPGAVAARGWTTSARPRSGLGAATTRSGPGAAEDKGQRADLACFVEACAVGAAMPISLDSLAATTRATIAVRDSLLSGKPEQGAHTGLTLTARLVRPPTGSSIVGALAGSRAVRSVAGLFSGLHASLTQESRYCARAGK